MNEQNEQHAFSYHCIVELFGHQKIAGLVTEQVIAGQSFICVNVPETKRHPAFTRMFGSGAIYSITPVSEEIAKTAAESIYIEPVQVYVAPERQLKGPDWDEDNGFDDDERED